ncbi:MAG: Co2+/Mg2+ efflux protein ApaG [Flavobacteriaceae bacterium]|nr:Co2+/Mg2+ efflux protein ApaG [Flavobacteriaceae bacterium]
MIQQITNGIKISIKTNFKGTHYQNYRLNYLFNYEITIENQSNDSVQLISRRWYIFDSLSAIEIIEGDGVIGKKPILTPKAKYIYGSFCYLTSPIGSMSGLYNMINFTTTEKFKVYIPTSQLVIPAILN